LNPFARFAIPHAINRIDIAGRALSLSQGIIFYNADAKKGACIKIHHTIKTIYKK
jgi:hypothetical protein